MSLPQIPKISEALKPMAEFEAKIAAPLKPMVKPLHQILVSPLIAAGLDVPTEPVTPAEATLFTLQKVESLISGQSIQTPFGKISLAKLFPFIPSSETKRGEITTGATTQGAVTKEVKRGEL
ncbi:MAG: hypothetical protein QXW83_00165 [Nitrososphaerales archaeon]